MNSRSINIPAVKVNRTADYFLVLENCVQVLNLVTEHRDNLHCPIQSLYVKHAVKVNNDCEKKVVTRLNIVIR